MIAAQREADEARASLSATMAELQQRLDPKLLVQTAIDGAKERAMAIGDDLVATATRNPAATGAIAAGAIALIARRPLWRGLRRLTSRGRETSRDNRKLTPRDDGPLLLPIAPEGESR